MAEEYLTDDEQLEAIKRGITENGVWIIGGVVLGAALLFGWRYYQNHRDQVAFQAAAQFDRMTAALDRNDRPQSRQLADSIIKDFPGSPYADQARLTIARLAVDDGQLGSASGPLTQVMNESKDSELKHIARLRLARVLTAEGKPDAAIALLSGDSGDPGGAFAALAHEVRGDAYVAKKDVKSALTEYQAALISGKASSNDAALLQLKIADLGPPPASVPAMVPASLPSTKATP